MLNNNNIMKKTKAIFVLSILLCMACNTNQKKAIAYHKKVIACQKDIEKTMQSFSTKLEEGASDAGNIKKYVPQIEKAHKEMSEMIQKSIEELNKTPKIGEETGFFEATLELFKFYQKICQEDYKSILEIYQKGKFTDEELQQIALISENIDKNEKPYDQKFKAAQAKFLKKFDLDENETHS